MFSTPHSSFNFVFIIILDQNSAADGTESVECAEVLAIQKSRSSDASQDSSGTADEGGGAASKSSLSLSTSLPEGLSLKGMASLHDHGDGRVHDGTRQAVHDQQDARDDPRGGRLTPGPAENGGGLQLAEGCGAAQRPATTDGAAALLSRPLDAAAAVTAAVGGEKGQKEQDSGQRGEDSGQRAGAAQGRPPTSPTKPVLKKADAIDLADIEGR